MKKNFFARTLLACGCACAVAASAVAFADTVTMPAATTSAPAPATLPKKGEPMEAVTKQFGEPRMKYPPVGGDSPQHPPITRWDYDGFSVFFENTHVVDSVVPGHPPPVDHGDKLRPDQQ